MAKKKPKFGVNNYTKRTPKKRPGRHTKRLNKHKKRSIKFFLELNHSIRTEIFILEIEFLILMK